MESQSEVVVNKEVIKLVQNIKRDFELEISKYLTEKIKSLYTQTSIVPTDIHIYHCHTMGSEVPKYQVEIDLKL